MTVSEILIGARDFLENHNWTRGRGYDADKDAFCATGALYSSAYGMGYWRGEPNDIIGIGKVSEAEIFLNNVSRDVYNRGIVAFNDVGAKRKRDVVSLFNKAIKRAQTEGR